MSGWRRVLSVSQRRAHQQRGVTLIETMVAMAVLMTGIAAVFGMAARISQANRINKTETIASDIFAAVAAQIADAQCDYVPNSAPLVVNPLTTDPAFLPPYGGGTISHSPTVRSTWWVKTTVGCLPRQGPRCP